jgi:hypothetical protein
MLVKMLRVSISVCLSCLIVVASALGTASATSNPPEKKAEKKPATPAQKGKTNTTPNTTGKTNTKPAVSKSLMEVVTELHNAKLLLDTAIHDYDGHRAAAVGEIKSAISALTPHLAKKVEGPTLTTTPGETQAESDAQLTQAHGILAELGTHISAKQHPKAVENIGKAVDHLAIALKIK